MAQKVCHTNKQTRSTHVNVLPLETIQQHVQKYVSTGNGYGRFYHCRPVSVCLSVASRHCIKTEKLRIAQITSYNSQVTVVL